MYVILLQSDLDLSLVNVQLDIMEKKNCMIRFQCVYFRVYKSCSCGNLHMAKKNSELANLFTVEQKNCKTCNICIFCHNLTKKCQVYGILIHISAQKF